MEKKTEPPYRLGSYLSSNPSKPYQFNGIQPSFYERKDGTIQITNYGELARMGKVMQTLNFILISKEIRTLLNIYAPNQFEASSTVIFREKTGERWDNYFKITALEKIEPDQFDKVDTEGYKVWEIEKFIYASPLLKNKIEREVKDLYFCQSLPGSFC